MFFFPSFQQVCFLKKIKSSIKFNFNFSIKKNDLPITGIYSMGSTSSIGQNEKSDLDIWIFHQSWLINKEKKYLKKKCKLIEKWAKILGVNVNFFLIDENYFYLNKSKIFNFMNYKRILNNLLLDEFYRTSVRIAGKKILWMIIGQNFDNQYEEYVLSLYKKKKIRKQDWIDLGRVEKLRSEEYYYANLSYLNKNIFSPYKTILKSTLLESYFFDIGKKELLSLEYKKNLHSGKNFFHGFDSYCLMLEKITDYLMKIKDLDRLDIIRICFYLKVSEKLSDKKDYFKKKNWKRNILLKLVNSWNWDKKKINILDKKIMEE